MVKNGTVIPNVSFELKAWNGTWYEATVRTQFCKDIKKMSILGDTRWVFKDNATLGSLAEFKNKIRKALTVNGDMVTPCAELVDGFDAARYKALFGIDRPGLLETPSDLLIYIFKDENFSKMFYRY